LRRWREKQHFLVVFFTGRAEVQGIGLRMNVAPYPFVRIVRNRYEFISVGKRDVQKVVEFTRLAGPSGYNMCLGDLLPDGGIDDLANTNNGDLVKVFATAIAAALDFLERPAKKNILSYTDNASGMPPSPYSK
jgi:hypothetical protein